MSGLSLEQRMDSLEKKVDILEQNTLFTFTKFTDALQSAHDALVRVNNSLSDEIKKLKEGQ